MSSECEGGSVVCVENNGHFYIMHKLLNEVDEDGYMRLWYIIKNGLDINDPYAINKSIMYINEKVYGMDYTLEQS